MNAFVIFVSVYYFIERHVKCRKSFVEQLEWNEALLWREAKHFTYLLRLRSLHWAWLSYSAALFAAVFRRLNSQPHYQTDWCTVCTQADSLVGSTVYKQLTITLSLWGLFCSNWLGMNFADCCTDELEFRICTICKTFNTKFTNRLKKMPTLIINVINIY